MSFPTKGSRSIEADGEFYRWYVRNKATYSQNTGWSPMTVAIQQLASTGVLLVDVAVARPDARPDDAQQSVSSAMVRKIIRTAITGGWEPMSASGAKLEFPPPCDA